MLTAFDTLLQVEVRADTATEEAYRYECLCCGEEVYPVAISSKKRVAHFKHRKGNNDTDCDKYLGQFGTSAALMVARRRKRQIIDFYYNGLTRTFEVFVSLPEEKILTYENKGSELQLRAEYATSPFETIKINHRNFAPDTPVVFPLTHEVNNFYISITGEEPHYYSIINKGEIPTFFKILGSEYESFRAKLLVTGIIYTNTRYFVVSSKKECIEEFLGFKNQIQMGDIEEIHTSKDVFWGTTLEIVQKNTQIENLLREFSIRLETAEAISILWPPTKLSDNNYVVDTNKVFMFSTFSLKEHSNTNINADRFKRINNNTIELAGPEDIKISYKNIDICLSFEENGRVPLDNRSLENYNTRILKVSEGEAYYLFNSSGVHEVMGRNIYLTPGSKVIRYKSNYPVEAYYPLITSPKHGVALLREVLMYYKVLVTFSDDMIAGYQLSPVAEIYIENSRASGLINLKALEFIKVGKI